MAIEFCCLCRCDCCCPIDGNGGTEIVVVVNVGNGAFCITIGNMANIVAFALVVTTVTVSAVIALLMSLFILHATNFLLSLLTS